LTKIRIRIPPVHAWHEKSSPLSPTLGNFDGQIIPFRSCFKANDVQRCVTPLWKCVQSNKKISTCSRAFFLYFFRPFSAATPPIRAWQFFNLSRVLSPRNWSMIADERGRHVRGVIGRKLQGCPGNDGATEELVTPDFRWFRPPTKIHSASASRKSALAPQFIYSWNLFFFSRLTIDLYQKLSNKKFIRYLYIRHFSQISLHKFK